MTVVVNHTDPAMRVGVGQRGLPTRKQRSTHRVVIRRHHADRVGALDKRWVPRPESLADTTITRQQGDHTPGAKGKRADFSRAWCSLVYKT